jgi:acyl-CoA synthetase (AMP-forming)/AMP-acid ligase II
MAEVYASLVDMLQHRAAQHAQRVCYTFLTNGEEPGATLTFGELDRTARAFARWLRTRGEFRNPILLVYPPGLDFVTAFFGCSYAGAIPVPASPSRAKRDRGRLAAIEELTTTARAAAEATPRDDADV